MAKIKNYQSLIVKLYDEVDDDIRSFLDEKDANTFITKEALRMYIKNYRLMEQMAINGGVVQQTSVKPPVPSSTPEPTNQTPITQIGDIFKKRGNTDGIVNK